ncbi:MAG: replication factor C large subunit [Desulfurococcaceae archaeon]
MSAAARVPWVVKYRPKKLEDYVNQDEAKRQLMEWLKSWEEGKPEKKAALLYGPAGTGKSCLVEALANTLGYQLFEMNASDARRREDIEKVALRAATTGGLVARKKIIFLDEVDGMNPRADVGGVDAILSLVEKAKNPIIMAANNPFAPELRQLREVALMIRFDRLKERHVIEVLKRICEAEKVRCESDALKLIALRSEGDLRSAINDLQAIAEAYGEVTSDLAQRLLASRDRVYAPYEALAHLFNAKYVGTARDALTSTDLDLDTFKVWIDEHIPTFFEDPEELYRAYESLSRADVYMGRIVRSGSWDLLSYAMDLMGPGVAFARKSPKGKWRKYGYPERLKRLYETRRNREILEGIAMALAPRLLASRSTIKRDVIPYLRAIFRTNPQLAVAIAKGYGFSDEMIEFLAGQRASEVVKALRKPAGKGRRA